MSPEAEKSIAIGFPGQGPHEPDRMRRLIREHPTTLDLFEQSEEVLDRPVLPLLLEERGSEDTTRENQIRLYLGSSALWQAAEIEGIVPVNRRRIFFGASAGEVGALMAAGAYDFATGLKIMDMRGEEMRKASIIHPGEMLVASGLPFEEAEKIAAGFPGVYAVNDNPGSQTVFSGTAVALKLLGEHLTSSDTWNGIKLHRPEIPEAAHSPHMRPAIKPIRRGLRKYDIKKPSYEFIGNRAKSLKSPRAIQSHLRRQLTRGVLLTKSADRLRDEYGADIFIDVGPGKVLYTQFKRHFRKTVTVISIVDELLPGSK